MKRSEPIIDQIICDLANVQVRARPCVCKVREAISACLIVCFDEQDRQHALWARRNAKARRK